MPKGQYPHNQLKTMSSFELTLDQLTQVSGAHKEHRQKNKEARQKKREANQYIRKINKLIRNHDKTCPESNECKDLSCPLYT